MRKTLLFIYSRVIIFLFCGTWYSIIEVLFKGPERGTHWTMFMLAGLSGAFVISMLNNVFSYDMDFLLQIIICAVCITIGEYIVGMIWNTDYTIWDYRNMPLNLNGQICVPFFFVWCLLSGIVIPILDYMEWTAFGYKKDTPPYYYVCGHLIFQFGRTKGEKDGRKQDL